ncbi:MAG: hypothetical protein J6S58_02210, partial [Lentisphaeria bacterium]|nr:hypothetical protein [Lentisphaeria bacterium]
SEIQSFEIKPGAVQNLQGDCNGLSWDPIPGAICYIVEYSMDNFETVISFETFNTAVDSLAMPSGNYQWRVKALDGEWSTSLETIAVQQDSLESQYITSDEDGNMDLFFVNAKGKWRTGYYAQHNGISGSWNGTGEMISLSGKNKLTDVIEGADANILVMSDDANGDALFVDDIYSALPGSLSEQQARIAGIDVIRAGEGDDIVDMTSQQFAYTGEGIWIYGGSGNDTIWANNGWNALFGDGGNDRLVGGSDDDVIVGGIGNDSMHGGGGDDIFTFGGDWGNDTVEQLAGGSVTLWFEDGSADNWDVAARTYSEGENSVTVTGTAEVILKFGGDSSPEYEELVSFQAFADVVSEKVFEDKEKGLLA